MLKTRIIPSLLWKDFGLVKGVGFDSWRRVGPIVPAVRVYARRDVDELLVLDIAASQKGSGPDYELVSEVADEATVPLTVGGGVSSEDHVARLLESGADKIVINTAAYDDLRLIERCAHRFGAQCIVLSIDYRSTPSGPKCYSHSGTLATDWSPPEWARIGEESGAGEILLTSIERDGTMQGYDVATLLSVTSAVTVPVIASGGAGAPTDMLAAVQQGHASAVAAASIYHFTQQTPREMRDFLRENGVPVRSSAVLTDA